MNFTTFRERLQDLESTNRKTCKLFREKIFMSAQGAKHCRSNTTTIVLVSLLRHLVVLKPNASIPWADTYRRHNLIIKSVINKEVD